MITHARPRLQRPALLSNAADAAGTQLYDTILSIVVVTALGFTATQLGLLNALGSLSFLLLVVPIGLLVDHWGPGRSIVLSLTVKLVAAACTLLLAATGTLGTLSTCVLVTIIGAVTVASENAQTALVPRISGDGRDIAAFIANMAAADRIVGIIAPALAGMLVALTGSGPAFALAVLLLGIAVVPALRLRGLGGASPDPGADREEQSPAAGPEGDGAGGDRAPDGLLAALTHGFVLLGRDRFLLGTTLLVAAGNIGLAMGDSLEPLLVLRELGLGTVFFGLLGTIGAVSGIAATFLAPRVVALLSTRRIFVVGAFVQSGVAALPLLSLLVPWIAYGSMSAFNALWAITLTITNIAGAAYAAQAVAVESLGRAAAARRMITMGCVPIAALASGALADLTRLAVPLLVWPLLTLAAAVSFLVMTRESGGLRGTRADRTRRSR